MYPRLSLYLQHIQNMLLNYLATHLVCLPNRWKEDERTSIYNSKIKKIASSVLTTIHTQKFKNQLKCSLGTTRNTFYIINIIILPTTILVFLLDSLSFWLCLRL